MKQGIKNIIYITIGCVLYSIGIAVFLQSNEIATGGFSGIALIINYLTSLKTGTVAFLLNIPVFFLAYKKLGKQFVLSTIYAVCVSSVLMNILPSLITFKTEPILASIYAGLFIGIGLGCVFRVGGSTGGTDIITRIVRIYKPHLSLGQIMIFIDLVIIVCGVVAFKNINSGLYAIITLTIATKMIDSVIEGQDLAKLIYIISDENENIAKEIGARLTRGSTLLDGVGAYTKADRKVLMCAVKRHQIPEVKQIASEIDQNAFMIVTDVREVLGYGFKIGGSKNGV